MSSTSANYDGSCALPRKLSDEEAKELRILLLPYFHTHESNDMGPEDISDFLDYTFAMISNNKSVDYVIQELLGMEMDFCPPAVADKIGKEMAGFIQSIIHGKDGIEDGGSEARYENGHDEDGSRSKKVSLKSSDERGNALTMSGALGASREGIRNNNSNSKEPRRKEERNKKGRVDNKHIRGNQDDRRDQNRRERDHGRGGRGERGGRGGGRLVERGGRGGGRSIQKDAFDRLSRGGRGMRDDDRQDRRRDDRAGRGRGRDAPGRNIGRGGPAKGPIARGGDRMSGTRRPREEYEEDQEFMPIDGGRGGGPSGGRGRGGRGRNAPQGVTKRQRYDDYHEGGYSKDNAHYNEEYGHGHGLQAGDNYGYSSHPPSRGRGRGRGFGGGRAGRAMGRGEAVTSSKINQEYDKDEQTSDSLNHPSPMVQASYSGGRATYGYSYGGRGRFGRGRGGRGRTFPGRSEVVNMIQSKTWVRKKEDGNNAGTNSDTAPAAETD